jgi:uncharacterized protein
VYTLLPAHPSSREDFTDELRGFALLGIVLVNAPFLAISSQGFTHAATTGLLDRTAAFLVIALAQAKFYLLFAFLFGYSLSFFIKAGDAHSIRRYKRRLLGLGVIGLMHAVLFFVGDILLIYALLGGALVWLGTRPDRVILYTVLWILVLWLGLLSLLVMLEILWPGSTKSTLQDTARFDHALASGSFFEATLARLQEWPMTFTFILTLNGLAVLAMFAVGLVAGRHKILAHPAAHAHLWQDGSYWGLTVGLPGSLIAAWLSMGPGAKIDMPGSRETAGLILGFACAPALSWGYVAWLVQLRAHWPRILATFRPAGRMSLTGYAGESILLSLLFCGYGAGLFGQLGAAAVCAVALGVWFALDLFAQAWQRFNHTGPLEFLLKRWTNRGMHRQQHMP